MELQRVVSFAKDTLLPLAQQFLIDDGELMPAFFIVYDRGGGNVDYDTFFPEFGGEMDKEIASMVVRSIVKQHNADAVIFVADAFRWLINAKAAKDAGYNRDEFEEAWSRMDHDEREKYGSKEECIQILIECKTGEGWSGWKSYKRDQGEFLFGELDEKILSPDLKMTGRFVGFFNNGADDGQKRSDDGN